MEAAGEASEERGPSCSRHRLHSIHERIINWNSDQSMIWDREPEEVSKFLMVVDEVRQFVEDLGEGQEELQSHAHNILQMAMERLEEEFRHFLVQYRQLVEPEHMWLNSARNVSVDDYSSGSFDVESIQSKCQSEITRGSEEFVIDLIQPDVILDLKSIAKMMFLCKYDKECCQAYIAVRNDAVDDHLIVLLTQRYSSEEVSKMDWSALDPLITRWNKVLKFFVSFYLASEKRLSDLIFGDLSESMREYCFFESSMGSIQQLLNLGEAIGTGPLMIEKAFRILDMYEGLTDLLVDIKSLYPGEYNSFVLMECHEVLARLRESLRGILVELENTIRKNTSTGPFGGSGIHPFVRYVMDYMVLLSAYRETIDSILQSSSFSMVDSFQSVASILETSLQARSTLCKDTALQNLFMQNNIFYMVQMVKDSDLQAIVGDDWIRLYRTKFQQYAINYLRASWSSVVFFLKDKGIYKSGSTYPSKAIIKERLNPSKAIIKERLKGFNLAFEEVYRTQTRWIVPNVKRRVNIRILISLIVIQAYRTFLGRYANLLGYPDRYIKYSSEDLERYLLDLFEGVPKVIPP